MNALSYDFSFMSIITGHTRKQKNGLAEFDGILLSIANNNLNSAKWKVVFRPNFSFNDTTTNNPEDTMVLKSGYVSLDNDEGKSVLATFCKALSMKHANKSIPTNLKYKSFNGQSFTEFVTTGTTEISPTVYTVANTVMAYNGQKLKLLLDNNTYKTEATMFWINNLPTSGKSANVFSFHVGDCPCLRMLIYAERDIPQAVLNRFNKPVSTSRKILNSLKSQHDLEYKQILNRYDALYWESSQFANSHSSSSNEEAPFHGPLITLLDMSVHTETNESNEPTVMMGALQSVATSILEHIADYRDEGDLLRLIRDAHGYRKQVGKQVVKPSKETVRALLNEMALISTRYSSFDLSCLAIILSTLLKEWVCTTIY